MDPSTSGATAPVSAREVCRAGQEAWPSLHVEENCVAAHLLRLRSHDDGGTEPTYLADLYLAIACAEGDHRAVSECERNFLRPCLSATSHLITTGISLDDAAQTLRTKVFLRQGDSLPSIS